MAESLRSSELAHTVYIDTRRAGETERHNVVTEQQTYTSLGIAGQQAQAALRNAAANAQNAMTQAQNAVTQARKVTEEMRANMRAEELRSQELGIREGQLYLDQVNAIYRNENIAQQTELMAKQIDEAMARTSKILEETKYLDDENLRGWMTDIARSLQDLSRAANNLRDN